MPTRRCLMALTLAVLAVPAAADPIAAIEEADDRQRVASEEIARILAADNVDPNVLTAREVFETIRAIPRGHAPDDFWAAYQTHVRAWEWSAAAGEKNAKLDGSDPLRGAQAHAELLQSTLAIQASFAEIRRIAESHGVAMPEPPGGPAEPQAE